MTTELSFLGELLLNHRLPKATREAVGARIKEVEESRGAPMVEHRRSIPATPSLAPQGPIPAALQGQAPSTIAAMMRHPDLMEAMAAKPQITDPQTPSPASEPQPVAVVAQTAAAAQALQKRQEAVNIQLSGKPKPGETGPRKW